MGLDSSIMLELGHSVGASPSNVFLSFIMFGIQIDPTKYLQALLGLLLAFWVSSRLCRRSLPAWQKNPSSSFPRSLSFFVSFPSCLSFSLAFSSLSLSTYAIITLPGLVHDWPEWLVVIFCGDRSRVHSGCCLDAMSTPARPGKDQTPRY